jgi:hypothetical protein
MLKRLLEPKEKVAGSSPAGRVSYFFNIKGYALSSIKTRLSRLSIAVADLKLDERSFNVYTCHIYFVLSGLYNPLAFCQSYR